MEEGSPMGQRLAYKASYESRMNGEFLALEEARAFLHQTETPASQVEDICTLLAEAFRNAVEHGNQCEPTKQVAVTVTVENTCVSVQVSDEGGLSVWGSSPDPKNLVSVFSLEHGNHPIQEMMAGDGPTRGWGLHLIHALSDAWKLDVNEEGTHLRMCVRLAGGGNIGERRDSSDD